MVVWVLVFCVVVGGFWAGLGFVFGFLFVILVFGINWFRFYCVDICFFYCL